MIFENKAKLDAWYLVEREIATDWESVAMNPDDLIRIEPSYDYADWRWLVVRYNLATDEHRNILACEHLAEALAFWRSWTDRPPTVYSDADESESILAEIAAHADEIRVFPLIRRRDPNRRVMVSLDGSIRYSDG